MQLNHINQNVISITSEHRIEFLGSKNQNQDDAVSIEGDIITETPDQSVIVYKDLSGLYYVIRNGIIRHPKCSSDDVIRALSFYL